MSKIKLLIFGDIVGKIGREALKKQLSQFKSIHSPDVIIANVENLAHGRGITENALKELESIGINIFTSGHHVWENKLGSPLLNHKTWKTKLIRPMNVDPTLPGVGYCSINIKGNDIVFLNLQGQLFMHQEVSSPFLSFDRFWSEIVPRYTNPIIIIDFHTETTSEKQALGHYVDGRANLLYGTHTHVPTHDPKLLEKGTAYITDIGMVGAYNSVIGFEKNSSIKRFLEDSKAPYKLIDHGKVEINEILYTYDLDNPESSKLEQIREIVDI